MTNAGVTIPSGLSAWWDTATAEVTVSPVLITPEREAPVESLKRSAQS